MLLILVLTHVLMWVVNFKKKRIMKKVLLVLVIGFFSCSEQSEQIEQDIDCGCKEIGYEVIVYTCNGGMNLCSRNVQRYTRDLDGCLTQKQINDRTYSTSSDTFVEVVCNNIIE